VSWLLLASSPPIAFVAFGNDALFNFLLGGQWHGGSHLAARLVLPAVVHITNWMDRLPDAVGDGTQSQVEIAAGLSSAGDSPQGSGGLMYHISACTFSAWCVSCGRCIR
jgi:hypothetical protein